MIIRTETMADFVDVYELNYLAFGNREDESKLVERIRKSEEFVPELSIVAEINNEIVGHLLLSKAIIEDECLGGFHATLPFFCQSRRLK